MELDIRNYKIEIREELLNNFMSIRFPNEKRGSNYWCEWMTRFISGYPHRWMDDQSQKVFIELINKL